MDITDKLKDFARVNDLNESGVLEVYKGLVKDILQLQEDLQQEEIRERAYFKTLMYFATPRG